MYGKKHKNKEKFRRNTYDNVDYKDTKIIVSKNGNKKITYRQKCPKCSVDVGYRVHFDAKRTCIKCQHDSRRLYTNIHRKIRDSMKANLSSRLKNRLIGKNRKSTFDMLNYTVDELKQHLESLWEPWMNWDNYGAYDKNKRTWQIDHRKPDSWFNYSSTEDDEFKECWSLSNLQPKGTIENIIKSNNFID